MSPRSPWPAALKHRDALLAAWLGLAWTLGCSVYEDSLLSNDEPSTDAGRGGTGLGGETTAGRGSTRVAGASGAGTTSGRGGVSGKTGVAGEAGDAGSDAGKGGAPDAGAGSAGTGAVAGSTSGGRGSVGGSGGSTGGVGTGGGSAGAPHDLATGKPATASSSQPDHTVSQGNDGSPTSRWAATNSTFPQWWRVDLGVTRHVISVALRPEHADRKYSYLVETSTNDNVYTEQCNTSGTAAVHDVDLPADVFARYVRITLTGSSSGNGTPWASFFEFSVTGD